MRCACISTLSLWIFTLLFYLYGAELVLPNHTGRKGRPQGESLFEGRTLNHLSGFLGSEHRLLSGRASTDGFKELMWEYLPIMLPGPNHVIVLWRNGYLCNQKLGTQVHLGLRTTIADCNTSKNCACPSSALPSANELLWTGLAVERKWSMLPTF